jgi:hypothetical protein
MDAAGFLGFARHSMAAVSKIPARHHELLIAKLQVAGVTG